MLNPKFRAPFRICAMQSPTVAEGVIGADRTPDRAVRVVSVPFCTCRVDKVRQLPYKMYCMYL